MRQPNIRKRALSFGMLIQVSEVWCSEVIFPWAELIFPTALQNGVDYDGACVHDSLAEWSTAMASGASPQGRGFETHSCHR